MSQHVEILGLTDRKPEPRPTGQDWRTNVLVPIVQNILGGLGVALLIWAGHQALARQGLVNPDPGVAWFWARVIGIAFASMVTVFRFFADDVGILRAAYQEGQESRQAEINRLQMELDAARRRLLNQPGMTGDGESRELARAEQVVTNARLLLERAYAGHSIRRQDVTQATAMGQKDWNRAYGLLKHAGVVDDDGDWLIDAYDDAMNALDDAAAPGLELASLGGSAAWAL